MKQNKNLSNTAPAPGDLSQSGPDRKGLLERLGDALAARIARNAGDSSPAGDVPAREERGSREAEIRRTLQSLGKAAQKAPPAGPVTRSPQGRPVPVQDGPKSRHIPRSAHPVAQSDPRAPQVQRAPAASARTSMPLRGAAPARSNLPPRPVRAVASAQRGAPSAAAPVRSRSVAANGPAGTQKRPYVSPIRRRTTGAGTSTSTSTGPMARNMSAAAAAAQAAPVLLEASSSKSVRLSEAEKNKVYERVRNLISTARESVRQAGPEKAGKALRICFLEDSCTSSQAIREMLGDYGHEVDHFSSAEEALDAVVEKDYDLLLASQVVSMGGMDCEDLIRAVRRAEGGMSRRLPVLALTADPAVKNTKTLRDAGADAVAVKPVQGGDLNDRIQRLVAPTPVPAAAPEHAHPGQARSALKVCFLEDSCTSSQAIREMLGNSGHEVDHFSSAEECLDALAEKPYDLLLASQIVALGGMDCQQLIRSVRHADVFTMRRLPIVALTADGSAENVQRFRAVGATDVIVKPVAGKALNERVLRVVPGAVPEPETRAPKPVESLKICFLEDSCTSSQAIREMLGEAGHEIDHFSSAEETLDAVMEKGYDLLLASQIVALGGIGCNDLIRAVRESRRPEKRNLPIVALTLDPEPANLESFRRAGADDVIIKPVDGKDLNGRIARVVGGKSAAAPPRGAPKTTLKVCFLEDSCTSSQAIREMLGDAGHEVDHFSSAEEALDAVIEKDYDALLASQIVALGGMDCAELIRTMRRSNQATKREMPIVALTLDPAPENLQAFRAAGADDVLVKPVPNLNERLLVLVNGEAAPAARSPGAARPQPRPLPETLRICFLEDSCTSSQAIREILGDKGHEVDHFSSAEETLDAVMERDYHLLLASQITALGGMDCAELVRTLRRSRRPDKRTLPIVVLTLDPDAVNIQSFRDAGADEVLVKPVEGDLHDRLYQVLSNPQGTMKPRLRVVPTSRAAGTEPTSSPAPAPVPSARRAPVSPAPEPATPRSKASPFAGRQSEPARDPLAEMLQAQPSSTPDSGSGMPPTAYGRERKLVWAVAIAGVLAVLGSLWHHLEEGVPVDLITVETGSLHESITVPGRVGSKKRVDVTSAVPGQLVEVRIKEGDRVEKGDVLARLDDRQARIDLQRAEANLESAKKDVAMAERSLDRLVRALQMGAVSRQMAEDAEAAVNASRAKQRVAAEEVRGANLALERLNVMAPFDGVVTQSFAIEGLWAEPPGPLFTVVDMAQREIEVQVDAVDSSEITIGQSVVLTSDAHPGQQWAEEIVRVSPATNRDNMAANTNTISVYVSLGPDAPDLRYGQQVDAEIRTASSSSTLKVPFGAVTTRNGRTVVAVVEEGRVHYKPVETGIEALTHVEIVSGLVPGDQVILLNQDLEEGQKVVPAGTHG